MKLPDIPENLLGPLRLLAGTATIYHGVLVEIAKGKTWEEVEEEHGNLLRSGEDLVRAWGEKLGLGD